MSFKPLLVSSGDNGRKFLYAEVATTNKQGEPSQKSGHTIRGDRYKYIVLDSGTTYFFDLQEDPYEYDNLLSGGLSADEQSALSDLKAELERIRDGK